MAIVMDGLGKVFDDGTTALEDLTLTVADGELMVVVGPSGCGKSTALRLIAGLEKPSSGTIAIDGRLLGDLSPRERDVAMVFQNYALYPHLSVYKNIAFPLREAHVKRDELDERVRRIASMLELDALLKRKPAQLSGGQRQRVAMARALVRDPKAFLLDEPLSNLDAQLRGQVRTDLKSLHQRLRVTSVYVTHDQVEAMTLGERIAVLRDGRLQQVGRPEDVFDMPANLFVAAFMGTPSMNLVRARVESGALRVGGAAVPVAGAPSGDVVAGFRPEALSLAAAGDGLPMIVELVEPLGNETLAHGTIEGEPASPLGTGEAPEGRTRITARLGPRDRPALGEAVPLALDPHELHLFNAESGDAIESWRHARVAG
jgi:sn-glycerol 3-phosphate transport system ATP-binding protein